MHESNSCKNCQATVTGKYCSNCGQATHTHRINYHFLVHEIQHGLLHFDGGVLYTIKELFTRPGASIREYIEGKRVKHFKPLSFVVLLATVYGLLSLYFHNDVSGGMKVTGDARGTVAVAGFNDWVSKHYVTYILISLPFSGLASYIVFRKQGYNLVEHLVLSTYGIGQMLVLQLLFFPLSYALTGTSFLLLLTTVVSLLGIGLNMWVNIGFFNKLSPLKVIGLSLLTYLLMMVFIAVVAVAAGIIYGLLFYHKPN